MEDGKAPDVRVELDVGIKRLSRYTIGLFLAVCVVAGLGFYDAVQRRAALEKVAVETHTALCNFKHDLDRRFETTKDYLEKHKGEREPIPGISRNDLRRSLRNQKATIDSLEALGCNGFPIEA